MTPRTKVRALLVTVSMAACALVLAGSGQALSDTTAPVLTAMSVSPDKVDLTSASATVTVTATITDDLSGVREASVGLASPGGGQRSTEGAFESIGGDRYEARVTLPRYGEPGTWWVYSFDAYDRAGNTRWLWGRDVWNLGIFVTVSAADANPDITAPSLSAVSVTPSSVDASSGPATVTVRATITDDLSGLWHGSIGFASPSGQYVSGNFVAVGGDQYEATVTFPRYAQNGSWRYSFYVGDNATNVAWGSAGPSDPEVVVLPGTEDLTPPSLSAFTVSPTTITAGTAPVTVTVHATITDELSGFNRGFVSFGSPSGQRTADSLLQHVEGDTYTAVVTFPAYAELGDWFVGSVSLTDNTGNSRYLQRSDLQPLGLDRVVRVLAADATPPVLAVPADFAVDATGPAGATVGFTVTATDNVDSQPSVSCLPAAGSMFPIGRTTVRCTATDAAGNVAHAQFDVWVKGGAEQLGDLARAVAGVGPGKSLLDKVKGAQAALAAGDPHEAVAILAAFVKEVKAQSGKSIPSGTATTLVGDAVRIETVLGR